MTIKLRAYRVELMISNVHLLENRQAEERTQTEGKDIRDRSLIYF